MNTKSKMGSQLILSAAITAAMCAPALVFGQSADVEIASNYKWVPSYVPARSISPKAIWVPPADALFNPGGVSDVTVAGCSGDTLNASQIEAPTTTFGLAVGSAANFRLADDFIVPAGASWTVQKAYVFNYQTGSTTTSTITSVNAQIWNGPPGDPASTIVCGDTSTNAMTATEFSGVYRVAATGPGCTRPMMVQTVDISSCPVLNAGTYWLDFQVAGTLASGPWAPPLAILGQSSTGNALQSNAGAWAAAVDATSADTFGLPFVIAGTSGAGVPVITLDTASATVTDQCASAPGQNNGVIEPGETVLIDVPINALNGDYHNVVATLGPAPAGITYDVSTATLGTITAGGSATAHFQIKADAGATCVTPFTLPIAVTSDDGGTSGTIASNIGASGNFPPTDVPVAVPDNSPTGGSSVINVTQAFNLASLAVHVDLPHTWVGDLTITLTSPTGTVVTLLDRPGVPGSGSGCNNNDIHVTFADGQPDPESTCTGTSADAWPVTDAAPATPLSALAGETTLGNWTLTAVDAAGGDTGSIVSWSLIPTPAFSGTCTICQTVSDLIFADGFDETIP